MRRLISLSCLVLLAAGGLVAAGELSNRRAPGFSLPDSDMQQHDLADYRGKVVIVNIMKTTCPHCTTFSKALDAAQKKYGPKLKVLSVVHPPDNQNAVRSYTALHQLSTTILFDCGQMAASYLKLGPSRPTFDVPHFFVIDQQGVIREDYGYNLLSKGLFEGDGIHKVIDKYVGPAGRAD
jgi:peroxiredoxin